MDSDANKSTVAENHPSSDYGPENVFVKRSGTTDKGKMYEDHMVSRLILSSVRDPKVADFQIWSNDENFGAFDDVLVNIEDTEGGQKNYAIQLKHFNEKHKCLTVDSLLSEKGNFSLKRYFSSFSELKTQFDNYEFIIWTNAKFKMDESSVIQNDQVEIKVVKCAEVPFLKCSSRQNCCYQFELVKYLGLSPPEVEDFKIFLRSFFLYPNQVDADHLESEIIEDFEKSFSCDDYIAGRYLTFVKKWSLRDGKKEKLDRERMCRVIALIVLHDHIQPFSFRGSANGTAEIILKAMGRFKVTLFGTRSLGKVQNLVSANIKSQIGDLGAINKIRSHYWTSAKQILSIHDLGAKDASKLCWLMDKCPVVVQDSPATRAAIELCPNGRYILIGADLSNGEFKQFSIFRNLSDLKKFGDIFDQLTKRFKCGYVERRNLTTDDLLEMVDSSFQRFQEYPGWRMPRYLSKSERGLRSKKPTVFKRMLEKEVTSFQCFRSRNETYEPNNVSAADLEYRKSWIILTSQDVHGLYYKLEDPTDLTEFEDFILESKFSGLTNIQKNIIKIYFRKGQVTLQWAALDEITLKERRFMEDLFLAFHQRLEDKSRASFQKSPKNSQLVDLESHLKNLQSTNIGRSVKEEIIGEYCERAKRSHNIIVQGVHKQHDDQTIIANILRSLVKPDFSLNIIEVERLERSYSHLIKVKFDNPSTVVHIMKRRHLLLGGPWDHVKIFGDKTPMQRSYLNNLRKQLQEKIDSGETNATIKYVNGVPRIIVDQEAKT